MEQERTIHFRNEPFKALVEGHGDQPIECTPVVYEDVIHCGVAVIYEDGKGLIWGPTVPRDLITSWRATEVLRCLNAIENDSLAHAYATASRDRGSMEEESAKKTTEIIGADTLDRIMKMPVPETIIRAILDNQTRELAPDIHIITNEVRMSTIEWRQEFSDAGIKHPNEVDAEIERHKQIVSQHKRLLRSYASSAGLTPDTFGMDHLEGALITLVEKGADKDNADHVVVALAGVVGDLSLGEYASFVFLATAPRTKEEADRRREDARVKALNEAAMWLHKKTQGGLLSMFGPRREELSFEDAYKLLDRLLDEYFPPNKPVEAA